MSLDHIYRSHRPAGENGGSQDQLAWFWFASWKTPSLGPNHALRVFGPLI